MRPRIYALRKYGLTPIAALCFVSISDKNVYGHPSGLKIGDAWWKAWNWDLPVLTVMAVMIVLYLNGTVRSWHKCGINSGCKRTHLFAYFAAWAAIGLGLLSPVDILSDDLAWVHMLQHLVLMLIAAPLMAMSHPMLAFAWSMPRMNQLLARWNQTRPIVSWSSRLVRSPVFCWIFFCAVLWIWHVPFLYNLALKSPLVHDIEHISFFVASFLFWRLIFDHRKRLRLGGGEAIVYLFATALHSSLLGGFMTLSPRIWYETYLTRTEVWSFTPLQDQQLAGLIMWMPGCAVYAIVAAFCLSRWIGELEPGKRHSSGTAYTGGKWLTPHTECDTRSPDFADGKATS